MLSLSLLPSPFTLRLHVKGISLLMVNTDCNVLLLQVGVDDEGNVITPFPFASLIKENTLLLSLKLEMKDIV